MNKSKGRYVCSSAEDVKELVKDIVETLKDYFWYIDLTRLYFVRSRNSRSRAIARIHGLSKTWLYVLNCKPMYVIEVISERFDKLSYEEKIYVLIHELLHIPKKFSGGLRPHKNFVNNLEVEKVLKIYLNRKSGQKFS